MDTRNRPTEGWEQQAALEDWLELLDSIGIDTKKVLAEEHDLLRKSRLIQANWHKYLENKPDSLNGAAHKAAENPDDYTAFVDTIIAGALTADPAVHDRVKDIIGRAGGIAAASAYRAFRSRGEGLYKVLTPRFKKIRDSIATCEKRVARAKQRIDRAAEERLQAGEALERARQRERDWLKANPRRQLELI